MSKRQIAAIAMGGISIAGGILAMGKPGEPERYLVSALVMIFGGVLWIACSMIPQLRLKKKHYLLVLVVIFLGPALGLFHAFNFCGGDAACFSYRGYPGQWLRLGQSTYTMEITWMIDGASFLATIVFWSGAGILLSCLWKASSRVADLRL